MQELSLIKKITKHCQQDVAKLFDCIPNSNHNLYFVGGCVRDAIANLTIKDIDLATPYKPDELIHYLTKANITTVTNGIEHGTITAILNKKTYEITTFRQDVKTYGRKADVVFTKDIYQDSLRRDFTINAIYVDINGDIYDPHDGIKDLDQGKIQFIGDIEQRIAEDFLRILRFFRFYALFGKARPNATTLQFIKTQRKFLPTLSKERITAELYKLLACNTPYPGVELMQELAILDTIFATPIKQITNLKHMLHYESKYDLGHNIIPRLLALVGTKYDLQTTHNLLRLSKSHSKQLHTLQSLAQSAHNLTHILYYHNKVIALYWYIYMNSVQEQYSGELLPTIQGWKPQKLPVTGQDLIELGYQPGKDLGITIRALEQKWIASNFSISKQELLQFIK